MVYQYPTNVDLASSNGLLNLLFYFNTVTLGWFANFILIGIYLIFASGYYATTKDIFGGFAVGGFVAGAIAIIMWLTGLIPTGVFVIAMAVAIISFIGLFIKDSG